MKKSLTIFLLLVLIFTLLLTLVACGDKKHEHKLVAVDAVEATCSQQGNKAYWYCTQCNAFFADADGKNEIEKDSWILPYKDHTFDEKWAYDTTHHWHNAICEHKDVTSDKGEHTFVDGVCTVCQYVQGEQPICYTITFYADDIIVDTIKSCGNEIIVAPNAPTIEGYEFKGWYLDNGVWQQPFVGEDYQNVAITKDLNVYAKYEKVSIVPKEYTITFYANDKIVSTIQSSGNEIITLPQATVVEGYEFKGWYLDNGVWQQPFSGDEYQNTTLTKNIEVYAKYEEVVLVKYKITFYVDGQAVAVIQSSGNEEIELPVAHNKDYHSFAGWYLDEGKWQQEVHANSFIDTTITHDINVYAKYEPILYEVSFQTNGGTPLSPVNVYVIQDDPLTTKQGYDFIGWYTEENFINKVNFPYYPSDNITLYAKWESNELKPRYTINSQGIITSVENLVYENTQVVIPDKVDGIIVRGLGSNLFSGNENIISLSMPDTVTTLQRYACNNCPNLREVILSPNVTSIPENMFAYCINLASINIPDTVASIGNSALRGTAITSLTIPASVKYLGEYAIAECAQLQSVVVDGVEGVAQNVFSDCLKLSEVVFKDGVKDLSGSNIFSGCSSLASITLPEHPVVLNNDLLKDTDYYNTETNWDNGVLYVGNHLICVNKKFTASEYTVRPSTIDIANLGFQPSTMMGTTLKKVILPEGLKRIGDKAFIYNDNLSSVNIPSTVECVGKDIFYFTNITSNYVDNWLVSYSNLSGEVLTIKEGTVGIANGEIFGSNFTIKEVILPSSLRYIGENNFKNFNALTTINLPSGLLRIADNAFNTCPNLVNINLQNCTQLEYIGETAFHYCIGVTSFYIPKSVTYVDRLAFNWTNAVINVEAQQNETVGWHEEWFGTYGQALKINYGVSPAM